MPKQSFESALVSRAAGGSLLEAHATLAAVLRIVSACFLVGVGAQVRIPVPGTDVPMTLQPVAVLVAGLGMRPRETLAALAAYLSFGAAGVPFFAPGSAGLAGPTGGYLLGFLAGGWLVSVIAESMRHSVAGMLLGATAGMAVILGLGVAWRTVWMGGSFASAVATGLAPFLVKAVVETALSVGLVTAGRRVYHRGRPRIPVASRD